MNSDPGPTVLFHTRTGGLSRAGLVRFARRLRRDIGGGRDFCALITGDAELQRMNGEFRGKHYPTDVLSFPSPDDTSLGEIAISMDRAREQGREFGHSVATELSVLMLHGVLHLTGLDHERDNGEMQRKELYWRRKFGLPSCLIERVSGEGSAANKGKGRGHTRVGSQASD